MADMKQLVIAGGRMYRQVEDEAGRVSLIEIDRETKKDVGPPVTPPAAN